MYYDDSQMPMESSIFLMACSTIPLAISMLRLRKMAVAVKILRKMVVGTHLAVRILFIFLPQFVLSLCSLG